MSDSLSVLPMAGYSMSQILVVSLIVTSGILAFAAFQYRSLMVKWRDRSQHWFSVAMGEKPMIDTGNAKRMMADLFPRPMGVPSPHRLVMSQAQREYRAIHALDHHRLHSIDAKCDSEAATELLQFFVGPLEIEGGE